MIKTGCLPFLLLLLATCLLNEPDLVRSQTPTPADTPPTEPVTTAPVTTGPAVTTAPPAAKWECPIAAELNGCQCIAAIRQLRCPNTAQPLVLTKEFTFASVVVQKGINLDVFFEKVHQSKNLKVESLTVQDFTPPNGVDGEVAESELSIVLSIAEKRLVIEGAAGAKAVLNAHDLQHETLDTFSVSNMKLQSVDFSKLKALKKLELIGVEFPDVTLNLDASSLTELTIDRSPNLVGASITADVCPATVGERIYLYARNNPKLVEFDLSKLKLEKPDGCHYHLDLSNNPTLSHTLLEENQDRLSKAERGSLFLLMRDTPQTCTTCLVKLAKVIHKDFLHSIQCDADPIKDQYLTEVPDTIANTKDCTP